MSLPDVDPEGLATTPRGFSAGGAYAGIKTYGEGKLDVALLASDRPCAVAGVFTKSIMHSAPVDLDKDHLDDGKGQAVVVNSGVANASTGSRGMDDARTMALVAARKLGLDPRDVFVCSTGVIGKFLPLERIEKGIAAVALTPEGGEDFARAIMTTDTRPKHGAVRFGPYTLGGCCKGSGMIHPNMATMLAFLTTDAPVNQRFLQDELRHAVDRSFNLVSVDGDTSPSDTVLLFANGAAGGETIHRGSSYAAEFSAALEALTIHLAKEVARDGEGATRLIEASVTNASSVEDARKLVRLLTTSYLLKSAVHGADPNWGRIVAVLGRAEVRVREELVTVDLCGHRVFQGGQPTAFNEAVVAEAMKGDTVTIAVDLGAGPATATGWGCDLTAEYVSINADYHT
ncbi:MAG TPA: bifunctional glutamate N-acetyltransferase/amino-acid acetyltransferase ArgJ [Tepidiformaceae bacterium]